MKMEAFPEAAKKIMEERFGHDCLIALATAEDNVPHVRTVNAYYEDGAFYVITYALSEKMRQIEKNPCVAVCGDWFTGHGTGRNLGWINLERNRELKEQLREVFAQWIDNGHTNFEDENTILLRIRLTDGILFSHGTRYDIKFM